MSSRLKYDILLPSLTFLSRLTGQHLVTSATLSFYYVIALLSIFIIHVYFESHDYRSYVERIITEKSNIYEIRTHILMYFLTNLVAITGKLTVLFNFRPHYVHMYKGLVKSDLSFAHTSVDTSSVATHRAAIRRYNMALLIAVAGYSVMLDGINIVNVTRTGSTSEIFMGFVLVTERVMSWVVDVQFVMMLLSIYYRFKDINQYLRSLKNTSESKYISVLQLGKMLESMRADPSRGANMNVSDLLSQMRSRVTRCSNMNTGDTMQGGPTVNLWRQSRINVLRNATDSYSRLLERNNIFSYPNKIVDSLDLNKEDRNGKKENTDELGTIENNRKINSDTKLNDTIRESLHRQSDESRKSIEDFNNSNRTHNKRYSTNVSYHRENSNRNDLPNQVIDESKRNKKDTANNNDTRYYKMYNVKITNNRSPTLDPSWSEVHKENQELRVMEEVNKDQLGNKVLRQNPDMNKEIKDKVRESVCSQCTKGSRRHSSIKECVCQLREQAKSLADKILDPFDKAQNESGRLIEMLDEPGESIEEKRRDERVAIDVDKEVADRNDRARSHDTLRQEDSYQQYGRQNDFIYRRNYLDPSILQNKFQKGRIDQNIHYVRLSHKYLCETCVSVNEMFKYYIKLFVLLFIYGIENDDVPNPSINNRYLCETCVSVNEMFKYYNLFSVLLIVYGIAFSIYYSLFHMTFRHYTVIFYIIKLLIKFNFKLLMIVSSPHITATEASMTREYLASVSSAEYPACVRRELSLFWEDVTSRSVEFSACGFITLNSKFVATAIAAGAANLIILIQFQKDVWTKPH